MGDDLRISFYKFTGKKSSARKDDSREILPKVTQPEKKTSCIYAISLGQDYHRGAKLCRTLEAIPNYFHTVIIVKSGALFRHNEYIIGLEGEAALEAAEREADVWYSQARKAIDKLKETGVRVEVRDWKEFIGTDAKPNPRFAGYRGRLIEKYNFGKRQIDEMEGLHEIIIDARSSVEAKAAAKEKQKSLDIRAIDFYNTVNKAAKLFADGCESKARSSGQPFDRKKVEGHCRDYILEELTVMLLWGVDGLAQNMAYPVSRSQISLLLFECLSLVADAIVEEGESFNLQLLDISIQGHEKKDKKQKQADHKQPLQQTEAAPAPPATVSMVATSSGAPCCVNLAMHPVPPVVSSAPAVVEVAAVTVNSSSSASGGTGPSAFDVATQGGSIPSSLPIAVPIASTTASPPLCSTPPGVAAGSGGSTSCPSTPTRGAGIFDQEQRARRGSDSSVVIQPSDGKVSHPVVVGDLLEECQQVVTGKFAELRLLHRLGKLPAEQVPRKLQELGSELDSLFTTVGTHFNRLSNVGTPPNLEVARPPAHMIGGPGAYNPGASKALSGLYHTSPLPGSAPSPRLVTS